MNMNWPKQRLTKGGNMPELKEEMGIKEKVHIVLRGPDGKVKQELKPNKNSPKGQRKEFRNGT